MTTRYELQTLLMATAVFSAVAQAAQFVRDCDEQPIWKLESEETTIKTRCIPTFSSSMHCNIFSSLKEKEEQLVPLSVLL